MKPLGETLIWKLDTQDAIKETEMTIIPSRHHLSSQTPTGCDINNHCVQKNTYHGFTNFSKSPKGHKFNSHFPMWLTSLKR